MPALVLGTAQWGAAYGLTNATGRPSDEDIEKQVALARACGITSLDTAAAYGDAQERIRVWAPDLAVVTKVSGSRPEELARLLDEARTGLERERLDGVLLHDWDTLDDETARAAVRALEQMRGQGKVLAVGVSVYDEDAAARALDAFDVLDIVQVPANAIDRRLDRSEVLEDVRARGGRLQVRSAFLQGVLVEPVGHPWAGHPAVVTWFEHCRGQDVSPLTAALAHVRALPWCDDVVIGVGDAGQLGQVIDAWSTESRLAPTSVGSDDRELIDPRTWWKAS